MGSLGFIAIGTLFVSAGLAYGLGFWVRTLGIEDHPDGARKTQEKPVSRLGGAAIALASGLSYTLLLILHPQALTGLASDLSLAIGFTIIAAGLGLWDDVWTVHTKIKLLILGAACWLFTVSGLVPEAFTLPFTRSEWLPLLVVGSTLWLLVFTNAANFMDGSNGLAIGCLAIMLFGLMMIGWKHALLEAFLWWGPLLGAVAGFLAHNVRGTLYAGDAGALGLGAVFAALSLTSGVNIWTLATLALPFVIDVLMTLIWRAQHKRSWLEPHLDHAYQRLRLKGWSHMETAYLYWGLSLCCATAAYIAAKAGGAAPFVVCCTLTLCGILLWRRHRRSISVTQQSA